MIIVMISINDNDDRNIDDDYYDNDDSDYNNE